MRRGSTLDPPRQFSDNGKGNLRYTAAFPADSKMRALPGWTGLSGCLSEFNTNTFDIAESVCPTGPLLA